MRNPSRTAVTSAALMIGLALVVFVAVFANGLNPSGPGAFSPYGEHDPLWDHSRGTWLFDMGALAATGVVFVIITALLLRRLEPKRRRGALR